ncbi:hypothetical protein RRG08_060626 [Elysia crispata]|uniref:Uncharacterized protein n=1 Tax=Elysia crispata TaxID=231223 RepID=A0AAE0Z4V9_9GAST|nr:hypothetical protein RRG08_060626 [Elysia crispata]
MLLVCLQLTFLTLACAAAVLLDVASAAGAAATTTVSPEEAAVVKVAKDQIAHLEQVVDAMARQLMQQQTFVEERPWMIFMQD